MPEGKDLAKTQWLYLVGTLTGGLLLGAALGAYVLAPALEKKKAQKE